MRDSAWLCEWPSALRKGCAPCNYSHCVVDSSWNMMAHGDAREGKWSGNWRMERVASTLHTTPEHGVSSITTADAHTSAASSRLNWCPPSDLNGLGPFRRKTKSDFCECAITFQVAYRCVRSEVTVRGLFLPAVRGSSGHSVTHPLLRSVHLHVYHSHVRFQFLLLNFVFVVPNFYR